MKNVDCEQFILSKDQKHLLKVLIFCHYKTIFFSMNSYKFVDNPLFFIIS